MINVLPTHSLVALCEDNDTTKLKQLGHFAKKETNTDLLERLTTQYPKDAAFTQYSLVRPVDREELPYSVRLKANSLPYFEKKGAFEQLRVSMQFVLLDWDLPSKGVPWTSEEKPESQEDIHQFIKEHDVLKTSLLYYFSKSGVRIVFALENHLDVFGQKEVSQWKAFYSSFVKSIDVSKIGGDIENRRDPFALSRVPNYMLEGKEVKSDLFFSEEGKLLKAEFPDVPSKEEALKQIAESKQYTPLPSDSVGEALWRDPFISFLRDTKTSLTYPDWRGLGTNVAALLKEDLDLAYKIFTEISSWDPKYDESAVIKVWPSVIESSESYGPVRWESFDFPNEDLAKIYNVSDFDVSALAVSVQRSARRLSSTKPKPKPTHRVEDPQSQQETQTQTQAKVDNFDEVYDLLKKSEKEVKGAIQVKVIKCITNLVIVLTVDNRWKGLIKRNHLGGVDYLGDEPITDEKVTSMRDVIFQLYGLSFSKDDFWDVIKMIASENEYHPVYDYLSTLKWDGVDRIPALARSLGQDPTNKHASTVLRKFIISAVVRPLEWLNYSSFVNWKIDTVLILKGAQGKRKSSFFKALCKDVNWFSDNLPSLKTERKDASLHMLGKWLVEQAEFEGHVARSSIEMMKAFVTREYETFRKPYGRAEISMRRPSILVGTTNSSSFLNDATGDRRYWVISIPDDTQINIPWVVQNRDQIWAQAKDLFLSGEQWWLSESEQEMNDLENKKYRRLLPMNEAVDEYLNTNPKIHNLRETPQYVAEAAFTFKNLVEIGLEKTLADLKPSSASALHLYLESVGWMKVRATTRGKKITCYRKLKDFNKDED